MSAPEGPRLSLRIAGKREIAQGIHEFELVDAAGGELPRFTPGAHLELRVPNGAWRKYSLCNDPDETHRYAIAVKRDDMGRGGSLSLCDDAKAGDTIETGRPRNDFPLSRRATQFVFLAGGIGITPILSMVRHLKSTGRAKFKLYYMTRSPEATAFAAELSGPDYHGQVVIHHDGGDPAKALDLWPILERPSPAHVYCCGPRPLIEAVRDMTGHWSMSSIHFESFVDGAALTKPDDRPFRVRLARSNEVLQVPVGRTILEVLRDAGHAVSSSCEAGSCGTCRTPLLAGEADHRDFVLTEADRDRAIMICVSRAKSDEITIDR